MTDIGERAIVSDDGEHIMLVIYAMHAAQQLAEVEMDPLVALKLAQELLRAAYRHLWLRGTK
jgi:hypothetical protein